MNKPEKPNKKTVVTGYARYDFNWVSKKVSWEVFKDWVKEIVPRGAYDVTLELREDWEYDTCFTSLEIAWKKKVLNKHYEKEMAKYRKKMEKWQKQQAK